MTNHHQHGMLVAIFEEHPDEESVINGETTRWHGWQPAMTNIEPDLLMPGKTGQRIVVPRGLVIVGRVVARRRNIVLIEFEIETGSQPVYHAPDQFHRYNSSCWGTDKSYFLMVEQVHQGQYITDAGLFLYNQEEVITMKEFENDRNILRSQMLLVPDETVLRQYAQ
jgi:hypothetical protein